MVNIRGQDVSENTLVKVYETTLDGILEAYKQTVSAFKVGIAQGAANIPLSLMSLAHFADFLHGGAYKAATYTLPYYNPAIQAQLSFAQSTITGFLELAFGRPTLVDLNATWTGGPLGTIVVEHPNPAWIALPPGAKPEQCEAIINSAAPHVLPKLLSDYDYYLSKEWTSLFFTSALITSTFQGISTGVKTLVQGLEGMGNIPGSSALPMSSSDMASLAQTFAASQSKG